MASETRERVKTVVVTLCVLTFVTTAVAIVAGAEDVRRPGVGAMGAAYAVLGVYLLLTPEERRRTRDYFAGEGLHVGVARGIALLAGPFLIGAGGLFVVASVRGW